LKIPIFKGIFFQITTTFQHNSVLEFKRKMKRKHLVSCFLFIICLTVTAQELPPIETFMPDVYGAEDQNWAITQSPDQSLYFANNKGLLRYNGAHWKLYPTPNSSIIRSVKFIDSKIYTGCYMDFGYWMEDDFGSLQYTSLVDTMQLQLKEDEEFWNILKLEHWILFQSLDRIYILDTRDNSINTIDSKTSLTKIYKVGNAIYFQKIDQGIYKLESGEERLLTDDPLLKGRIVVNIYEENGQLIFHTKEDGFYTLLNNTVVPWNTVLNQKLSQYSIYNSIRLKNGDFVLGTVSNGIIYINSDRQITLNIDQSAGLGNNTVLSLLEDQNGNVWLGLDHGINNINFNAPFRVYKDDQGVLGTVYTALIDDGIIYLGTNQGLFYKTQGTIDPVKFVEGTEGQVWFLDKIDDTIFCGHDKGTFIIENRSAVKISPEMGTWQIRTIDNKPNLLIQGNYNGLYILEKQDDRWQLRNKLNGFDISSRYIEFADTDNLLVSHEHKGVYHLKIDDAFTKVISYQKTELDKSIKSSLSKYDNRVIYGASQGVFAFDGQKEKFVKDEVLSSLYNPEEYISGKLVNTDNKLFVFTEKNIAYAEKGSLSADLQLSLLPLPQSIRATKDGYENILHIGDEKYLIGTTRGYIITRLKTSEKIEYVISLDAATSHQLNKPSELLNLTEQPELAPRENHIKFSFSVRDYSKYLPSLYQYRLLGFNENWSDWSESSEAIFENLPHGDYTFEARAKVGDVPTENTVSYNFVIGKPWHLSSSAIVVYFVIGFLLVVFFHMLHRRYYRKQRRKLLKQKEKELEIKQLENEQQLMHYKNLDLQKDIETKNRELGMSAMNLVKRNELLGTIKKELGSAKNLDDVTKVVKMINKNLNTTDDWKLFEEAFNNTDKDFIKKLKTNHPNLTSNDLRLCTYLRLNLSSKEIAPLLNISLRSVEVKRYRLRKKMNLPHEASLTNYILDL
jgi:ligand-binding sensor domain-containing protein/DNA-binding CsgD family transcriptional regulator